MCRIERITVELLKVYGNAKVLVVGLLPRGARGWAPDHMVVHSDNTATGIPPNFYNYPNPTLTPMIDAANVVLRERIVPLDPGRSHYIECSSMFLDPAADGLKAGFMPDGVHPSSIGASNLAVCIGAYLQRIVLVCSEFCMGPEFSGTLVPIIIEHR